MNKHEMVENILKLLDNMTVTGSKNVIILCEAFQILFALQKGLKEEDNAKNKIIEELKEQLKRANEERDGEDGGIQ